MKKKNTWKLPHIGMRIIKSALGVLICFAIYFLRGEKRDTILFGTGGFMVYTKTDR